MKKSLCVILLFCLLAPVWAFADQTVVTALAAEVNPDALVSVAVDARITAYNPADNTLTLELIVPESYYYEDIWNLQAGDAIYTQGREIPVRTVTEDENGYIILNQGEDGDTEDTVWLYQYLDQNYQVITMYSDNTWTLLATVSVPVPQDLIFLDGIDPSTLQSRYLPAVHDASAFLSMMEAEKENGPGFAVNNTTVVFNSNGELALIRRYYVPWQ